MMRCEHKWWMESGDIALFVDVFDQQVQMITTTIVISYPSLSVHQTNSLAANQTNKLNLLAMRHKCHHQSRTQQQDQQPPYGSHAFDTTIR